MAKFAYNFAMHSSTQETPFFANHGLYPNFDILGCITSWILQLRIEPCGWQTSKHNLYQTWKGTKTIQGKCWYPSQGSTKFEGRKPNVASTTHQQNLAFEEIELPKIWSILVFHVSLLEFCHAPTIPRCILKNVDQVYAKRMVLHGEFWF